MLHKRSKTVNFMINEEKISKLSDIKDKLNKNQ
jgi:hypothetical protein